MSKTPRVDAAFKRATYLVEDELRPTKRKEYDVGILKEEMTAMEIELSALRAAEMPEEPPLGALAHFQEWKDYSEKLRSQLAAVMVEMDALQSKLSAAYAAVRDANKYGVSDTSFTEVDWWAKKHARIIAESEKMKP